VVPVCKEKGLAVAVVERVEPAVGVLLGLAEGGDVELVAARVCGAEEAYGPVGVAEEEAAEGTDERLRGGGGGRKVEVRGGVGDLVFEEVFLQGEVGEVTLRSLAHVGVDHGEFVSVERVEVDDGRDDDLPVGGLERGVPLKEVQVEDDEI